MPVTLREVLRGTLLCALACAVSARSAFFDQRAPDTLRQVHVIMRHGERAPFMQYPTDPYGTAADWPLGFGELTMNGLRQHDRLGRWFRVRYDNILDRRRNYKQVKVISTDSDRTINSAQANLAGLYHNEDPKDFYNPALNWVPFPVHAAPKSADKLLHVEQSCAAIRVEESQLWQQPFVREMVAKASPLLPLLTTNLAFNVSTLIDITFVSDNINEQIAHNIRVPEWIKPHLPLMEEVARFCTDILAYTPELKMLRGGPLIQKIGTEMLVKAKTGGSPHLFMYSAHQFVLAVNLQTVGAFNKKLPPFAAAVIYELHELGQDNFVVRMMYHNDSTMSLPPHNITVAGCGDDCPLEQWSSLFSPYLSVDYGKRCLQTEEAVKRYTHHEPFYFDNLQFEGLSRDKQQKGAQDLKLWW